MMRGAEAEALAVRLASGWPGLATQGWAQLVGEKLRPWDVTTAQRAVEALIDSSIRLPTVADLRQAYQAAGGDLPDPGRRMSPPAPEPPPPTAAERVAIAAMRRKLIEEATSVEKRLRGVSDGDA